MEHCAYWALVETHLPALKEHARKIVYYVLRNSRPGSIYTADDLLHDTLLKVGKSTTSKAAQPDPGSPPHQRRQGAARRRRQRHADRGEDLAQQRHRLVDPTAAQQMLAGADP